MRTRSLFPLGAAILALIAGGAGAHAAASGEAIGSAVTVVNYVTASLDDDARRLSSGDDVRQQELIQVNENSRSEIELNDRTRLALGPGARVLLDRFVYDPDLSGGAIVMNFVKGTFRWITGVAAKPAYVVRTPNASITVRGTIFDVFIKSEHETWLLLIEGAVEACNNAGRCRLLDQPGKLIRITDDDVEKAVRWSSFKNRDRTDFDDAFPFISEPPLIDHDPIFTRADIVSEPKKETEYQEEKPRPQKTKPSKSTYEEEYTPPKRTKIYREPRVYRETRTYREYPRETRYYPERPRGGRILKKAAKAGLAVGVGLGVGYGIAKVLKRRY